jgi:hypothetical protein
MRLPRMIRWMVPVLLLASPVARADATMSIKAEFKQGGMIPASTWKQAEGASKVPTSGVLIVQLKGDKELVSTGGSGNIALIDFANLQFTMLDAVAKTYALVDMKDIQSKAPTSIPSTAQIPPQMKLLLQMMKATFSAHKTGRTDTLVGVHVEEVEWALSFELPPGALPLPGVPANQALTLVKATGHTWEASEGETKRVAALGEMYSHRSIASKVVDAQRILKPLEDYPGLHDGLAPLLEKMVTNPPVTLKLDVQLYVPVLAQLQPFLQAQGSEFPQGMDPNAPLGTLTVETTELSGAPLSAAIFRVPDDFRQVSSDQMTKPLLPATSANSSRGAAAGTSLSFGASGGSAPANSTTPTMSPSQRAAAAAAVIRNDH